MSDSKDLMIKYCKVYSAWVDTLQPGSNLPTSKQREEWHRATKAIYDYSEVPYPDWLKREFETLSD